MITSVQHECRLKPEESSIGFQIIQPGSSVATSFCDGEAGPKYARPPAARPPATAAVAAAADINVTSRKVGVLEVRGDQWRVLDIPLCTVRPFIMDSIVLESEFERQSKEGAIRGSLTDTDTVSELLSRKVEEMISSVPRVWPYNAPNRPSKPLIRLRVESATGMTINPARFGQQFVESVANPTDILLFQRKKRTGTSRRLHDYDHQRSSHTLHSHIVLGAPGRKRARSTRNANGEGDEDDEDELGDEEDSLDVSTAIRSFLSSGSRNELSILPEYDLNIALQSYVDKGDNSAISEYVLHSRELIASITHISFGLQLGRQNPARYSNLPEAPHDSRRNTARHDDHDQGPPRHVGSSRGDGCRRTLDCRHRHRHFGVYVLLIVLIVDIDSDIDFDFYFNVSSISESLKQVCCADCTNTRTYRATSYDQERTASTSSSDKSRPPTPRSRRRRYVPMIAGQVAARTPTSLTSLSSRDADLDRWRIGAQVAHRWPTVANQSALRSFVHYKDRRLHLYLHSNLYLYVGNGHDDHHHRVGHYRSLGGATNHQARGDL